MQTFSNNWCQFDSAQPHLTSLVILKHFFTKKNHCFQKYSKSSTISEEGEALRMPPVPQYLCITRLPSPNGNSHLAYNVTVLFLSIKYTRLCADSHVTPMIINSIRLRLFRQFYHIVKKGVAQNSSMLLSRTESLGRRYY